jgi:hypothetical protein
MGARAKAAPIALKEEDPPSALIADARAGEVSTRGRWTAAPDGLRLAQANPDKRALVRVVYRAAQALAVLAPPPGRPARFFIKLDGGWLYEGIAGRDVRFDDDGRSYVAANAARLYDLARDSGDRLHELSVIPDAAGSGVHGFSFADGCAAAALP